MNAQVAYERSMKALDVVDIDEELDAVLVKIEMNSGVGLFGCWSGDMKGTKADKLSVALEDKGYVTQVMPTNNYVDGHAQFRVAIGWKSLPANTRERLTK